MNSISIGPGAAIDAIRRRQSVRIYAETPALKLLGLEDKYAARIEWKRRLGKPLLDAEPKTLDAIRSEMVRRSADELALAKEEFKRRNKFWTMFPDEGPYRRALYPKHMEVIGYTLTDEEILMLAANRIGKSLLGAYITTAFATGRYPSWWHGCVFDEPITAWVCNKTAKDTRDINEAELLGPPGNDAERGTAMIPAHLIGKCTPKPGTPHAFEFIQVEHVSGGTSYIGTKSYDQGREAFQGRGLPFIWNDEEVPKDVADEEKLRIMTFSNGRILHTYTPINGLTEMTMEFMESAGLSIEAMRQSAAEVELTA